VGRCLHLENSDVVSDSGAAFSIEAFTLCLWQAGHRSHAQVPVKSELTGNINMALVLIPAGHRIWQASGLTSCSGVWCTRRHSLSTFSERTSALKAEYVRMVDAGVLQGGDPGQARTHWDVLLPARHSWYELRTYRGPSFLVRATQYSHTPGVSPCTDLR
jgi:hypothetical protein